jgi:diguanylate cyclase (GGDEF)-like protein/PAS domain S-box-containing protein
MRLSASRIYLKAGKRQMILLAIEDITESRLAERDLMESEEYIRHLYETTQDGILLIDKQYGSITYVNSALTKMLGYSSEECIGKKLADIGIRLNREHFQNIIRNLHESDVLFYDDADVRTTAGQQIDAHIYLVDRTKFIQCNVRVVTERRQNETKLTVRSDNLEQLIEERTAELTKANKLLQQEICNCRHVQEELREAAVREHFLPALEEEALRKSQNMFQRITESVPGILYIFDLVENRLVFANREISSILGYSHEEIQQWGAVWPENIVHPEDFAMIKEKEKSLLAASNGDFIETEIRIKHACGEWRWVSCREMVFTRTKEGLPKQILGNAHDITGLKHAEEEIKHLAYYDELTGLPNRRLFTDFLSLEMARSRRNGKKVAILFLDLDRFKDINDTLGHEAGDELLKVVADRLKATVRAIDTVARIAGDEFTIILSSVAQVEDAAAIAQKIIDSFQMTFLIAGNECHMTTSLGISVFPDDSEEIDTLMTYADMAMYHVKKDKRNAYQFYNPELNVRSNERMRLYTALRQAVERGELSVHYHPQIDMKNRKIVCAEALVRWQHPEMGLLEAERFIPLAEETGLIMDIDEWVLRTVCAQVESWKETGLPPVSVSVNLSSRQFQSAELPNKVSLILNETGMSPDRLHLEITEGTAMNNIGRTAANLQELVDMGLHISIDHFGTGYLSLNHLKRLPVERLKIDKSFVRDVATDSNCRAIIGGVTAMAYTMGLKVMAEGVETEDQILFLRLAGCDEMQGFLFSRPLPAGEFAVLLTANK